MVRAWHLDLIGTEEFVDDVLYLQRLNVFSKLYLLKHWCEWTPRMIFPESPGWTLARRLRSPLADFSYVQNIRLRFKQGFALP
jgi:hypothetical protein